MSTVQVASTVQLASISGDPTDEEVAAILAAIEVTRPQVAAATEPVAEPTRWRFSGRPWSEPVTARRRRP